MQSVFALRDSSVLVVSDSSVLVSWKDLVSARQCLQLVLALRD